MSISEWIKKSQFSETIDLYTVISNTTLETPKPQKKRLILTSCWICLGVSSENRLNWQWPPGGADTLGKSVNS